MWTKKALVSVLLGAGMLGASAVSLPAAADAVQVRHDRHGNYQNHWGHHNSRWDRDGDGIPNRYDRTPYGRRFVDSDRDGIPNRYDRTPYGRRYADRDRDGVPNRYDSRPNNPYWY